MSDQAGKKLCPKCKMEVDPKASRCPYCRAKIYVWTKGRKILMFVLAPLLIIVVIGMANTAPKPVAPRTAEQIASQKQHDFAALAKMNVEGMLKAPSTAKFDTTPKVTFDGKTYSIESWVDSENSFGAMIRSYWSVKAHYIGGDSLDETGHGANWIIDEFVFDGKRIK